MRIILKIMLQNFKYDTAAFSNFTFIVKKSIVSKGRMKTNRQAQRPLAIHYYGGDVVSTLARFTAELTLYFGAVDVLRDLFI